MTSPRSATALALACGSGALLVLAFPKFDIPLLSMVALMPLLVVAAREPRGIYRFLDGLLAGCVFFGGTCYWIYTVMRTYGGLGPVASAGVFLLFFIYLGLYWGVFTWMAGSLWEFPWGAIAIPFVWVALELARTYLVSGFPWLLLGYSLTDDFSLARIARWTGVYGLSYLVASFNVASVWLVVSRSRASFFYVAGTSLLFLTLMFTAPRETYTPHREAYLVQTEIPESVAFENWDMQTQSSLLDRLRSLTKNAVGPAEEPPLVIWPEVPAPFYYYDDSFTRVYAEDIARETGGYFLMGIIAFAPGSRGTQPLNSAVLLDPSGSLLSQYDKIHLVPFGEYVPLHSLLRFAGKLTAEVGDFVPGTRYVVNPLPGGTMSVLICYEAVFPDLVRRFVRDGAGVLVNISNDGWYGSSAARYQHLLMARMRAIENARYLLRTTNTGITVVVQPDGRIAAELPPDQPGVLKAAWDYDTRQTFYTLHGDWFAYGSCVLAAVACLAAGCSPGRRFRKREGKEFYD